MTLKELIKKSGRTKAQIDGALGGTGKIDDFIKNGVPSYYVNLMVELLRCKREDITSDAEPVQSKPIAEVSLETICEVYTVDEMQDLLSKANVTFSKRAREKALARLILKHKLYIDNL